MGWDIIFDGKAQKQLLKLDIEIQRRIKRDINEKLLMNPDYHLEGLEGEFKKYYKFHHVPYALRKSTFESFFESNKEIEVENIRYKFRNLNQFTPQGLINHLEIKNKTCVLSNKLQLIYMKPIRKSLWELKYKLNSFSYNKLFLCLQSLDQCKPNKLKYLLNWLTFLVK